MLRARALHLLGRELEKGPLHPRGVRARKVVRRLPEQQVRLERAGELRALRVLGELPAEERLSEDPTSGGCGAGGRKEGQRATGEGDGTGNEVTSVVTARACIDATKRASFKALGFGRQFGESGEFGALLWMWSAEDSCLVTFRISAG